MTITPEDHAALRVGLLNCSAKQIVLEAALGQLVAELIRGRDGSQAALEEYVSRVSQNVRNAIEVKGITDTVWLETMHAAMQNFEEGLRILTGHGRDPSPLN